MRRSRLNQSEGSGVSEVLGGERGAFRGGPPLRYAIIEAPTNLGLRPTGVEKLADTLLSHGLDRRIQARRAGRLTVPPYDSRRGPPTNTLNGEAIAAWSPMLADAVEGVLDQDEFPIVLGGDCSIVLGSMLALKRRGRYGLLFIDGHTDFYHPDMDPEGEAASMDLAFATGYGPSLLTDIERRGPLVRSADVVAFGFRDMDEQAKFQSPQPPADLLTLSLPAVREMGVETAARDAAARLSGDELDGFFIHFDADVLDDAIMPAVEYRIPDGLSWDEMKSVLGIALASGKAVGLEVTIYNPDLDKDGAAGLALTDALVEVLGDAARKETRAA